MTAHTASRTVMAEQNSHNVVENTESTSASAPVDVAANQTITATADHGPSDEPLQQTKTDRTETSHLTNENATEHNAAIPGLTTDIKAGELVVDPSAGDTSTTSADAVTVIPTLTTTERAPDDSDQLVNGVGQTEYVAADDSLLPEGSIDVSMNSDAEGSRGDGERKTDDEKHHARTNSVKKPTTFSKVSVTKNFLAKSATTTQSSSKIGDKPSPTGTPPTVSLAARPRLIAKTGASIQQKTRLGSDSASGPDASKVWNKNRPVAPAPPKQFTDEELKQQYGIHLATRLQTDENGKDKTWADIDDDEDDWAPDSVVWMDGTKSTLTPSETATPFKEQKAVTPPPEKPASGVRPTLAVKRTELGPAKTILKPGAKAAAAQAQHNGASTAAGGDKAAQGLGTLPPAKSPWAQLPPVERISPVNPPVQQQMPPQRLPAQDARAYEPALPAEPPREMATDTFRREQREGGPRELFNSANGLYEPVTDQRRQSIKLDPATRKTALLSRSSHSGASPAEPSAAFQTRTASQAEASMGHRRGSNVSQSSLPRRMSTSKGSDLSPAPERRTSTVVGHDMRASPQMTRAEPMQPATAQQTARQHHMPQRPEPGTETEDPVQKQERIMREKRELAKKRRQEEEEQKEAEKQKRLQARLAALEGAGKSRKEREAEAAAAAAAAGATSSATEPPSDVASSTPATEKPRIQTAQPVEISAASTPPVPAPSLPPVTVPAEPHEPIEDKIPAPLPSKAHVTGLPERPVSSSEQTNPRQTQRSHPSPRGAVRAPFQGQTSTYSQAPSSYSSPGDRKLEPFGRSPIPSNNGFATAWPPTASIANVWSTSGIGNGVFDSSNAFSPMQQASTLPPPPGMNRPSTSNRISPQAMAQDNRSPSLQQNTVADSHRSFAPPGFEARADSFANQNRANGNSPAPGMARQPHAPGPIAPPSRAHQQSNQHDERLNAWNTAAQTLPEQYRTDAHAAAQRSKMPSTPSAPREDTIKETFRKTIPQATLGGPRKYGTTEYTVHDAQGSRSVNSHSPASPHGQVQPNGPFATKSPLQADPWSQSGEKTVRIPDGTLHASHGAAPIQQPPIAPPSAMQQQRSVSTPLLETEMFNDESPPPPELSSHPVNNGNSEHPLVRLPPGKPIVKLPPAPAHMQPPVGPPQNTMMPQRPISNLGAPGSSRPIVMQQAWQERFNGLFNRTPISTEVPPSPPGTPPKEQSPALAVAASTRMAMDEGPGLNVSVSLPQSKRNTSAVGFTLDDSDAVTSKDAFEDRFMEELRFGSKPTVEMPRRALYHNKIHLLRPFPQKKHASEWSYRVESLSLNHMKLFEIFPKHRDGYFVYIPTVRPRGKLVRPRKSGPPGNDKHSSGRFNKGKSKETTPGAPTPTGPSSNTGSKSESVSDQATPAVAPSPGTENKHSGYQKPRRGGRRSHAQPYAQPVKATS